MGGRSSCMRESTACTPQPLELQDSISHCHDLIIDVEFHEEEIKCNEENKGSVSVGAKSPHIACHSNVQNDAITPLSTVSKSKSSVDGIDPEDLSKSYHESSELCLMPLSLLPGWEVS